MVYTKSEAKLGAVEASQKGSAPLLKALQIVISLGYIYGAHIGAADGPILGIKGLRIGMTRSEMFATMKGFECSAEAICTLSTAQRLLDVCGPAPRKECEDEVWQELEYGPVRPLFYSTIVRDGRLSNLSVTFQASGFSDVVAALTERYGTPAYTRTRTMQNRLGATYPNRVAGWSKGGLLMVAQEQPTTAGQSMIIVSSERWADDEKRDRLERAREAAKRL